MYDKSMGIPCFYKLTFKKKRKTAHICGSYDPRFSSSNYGPSAVAILTRSVTYSTDREDEVSKILLYLYCASDGFGNDFYIGGTASNC